MNPLAHKIRRLPALAARAAPSPAPQPTALRATRLLSLDAFRGLTIAAMILVNNPGSFRHIYPSFQHAAWNGCAPADLIFPFFLFIVGVSITLSAVNRIERGDSRAELFANVLRRTLILFGLGVLLNGFPYFDWDVFRIPGVLQRIAVCYFVAATVALRFGVRGQVATTVLLLAAYWLAMTVIPVPGFGRGDLGPEGNLAAYIDRRLMGSHLLDWEWDPEGLLSTIPAVATTLGGVLTGRWLVSETRSLERVVGLFVVGNAALVLGLVMNVWLPINKTLWSSSYAVFTAGAALNVLGMCYWLIDIKGHVRWAAPFVIYGRNPIVAYFFSSLVAKALQLVRVTMPDGGHVHLKQYLLEAVFLPVASPAAASLLYALMYTLLWWVVTAILYRRRIFIKI